MDDQTTGLQDRSLALSEVSGHITWERHDKYVRNCFVNLTSHQDAVFDYCRRRATLTEAEEATSEVMVIALRRQADLPGDNLRAYLYGIAYKVLANQRRASRRQVRVALRSGVDRAWGPEEVVIAGEEAQLVTEGLGRLGNLDQEILRLAAWEELSRAEIATALGCSENAVTKRFSRALDRLAAELGVDRHRGTQFFRRNER